MSPVVSVGPAQLLLDGLTKEGQISPSIYETGRVVSLLPGLDGHPERIEFLLATQRSEGYWGPEHAGYALIPTLSAIEALFAVQWNGSSSLPIASALRRALLGLAGLTRNGCVELPDLPAADLVVSFLIPRIERHLEHQDPIATDPQSLPPRLRDLARRSGGRLNALTARLSSGMNLDRKLLHAAETLGEALRPDLVQPSDSGSIGASPAATAAWLAAGGSGTWATAARRYLENTARRYGGPLPCVSPAAALERAWVLNWLLHARVPVTVPEPLRQSLRACLGPGGAAASPGLPADADTTSMVLATLTLLGEPLDPAPLLRFDIGTHFCTWPGEDGQSVTTNAHVLEALGLYVPARPAERGRYTPVIRKVAGWLLDQQQDSGSWEDRWHASPYYATFCAALALHRFAGPRAAPAMARTVRWLLDTQRSDASWGIWEGTLEETAYAVQLLTRLSNATDRRSQIALRKGRAYLSQSPTSRSHPMLWHDKDLYVPEAVISAALLTV